MLLSELKNYLAIYQLQGMQEDFFNRKTPPTSMQRIEYFYTCYELQKFINLCHDQEKLDGNKISQLIHLLQRRALRIKDSKCDYLFDPTNPANQMCYQIAKNLQASPMLAAQLILTKPVNIKLAEAMVRAMERIDVTPRTRTRKDDIENPKPFISVDIEDDIFAKIAADQEAHHLFLQVDLFVLLNEIVSVKNKIALLQLLLDLGEPGISYLRSQISNFKSLQPLLKYLNEEQRIQFVVKTDILNKLMAPKKRRHRALSEDEFVEVLNLFNDGEAILTHISPEFLSLYRGIDKVAKFMGDALLFDLSDIELGDGAEEEEKKEMTEKMEVVAPEITQTLQPTADFQTPISSNGLQFFAKPGAGPISSVDLTEDGLPLKKRRVGDFAASKAVTTMVNTTPTLFHHKEVTRLAAGGEAIFAENYSKAVSNKSDEKPLEAFYYIRLAYNALFSAQVRAEMRSEGIQQLKAIASDTLDLLVNKEKWDDCYRYYACRVKAEHTAEWSKVAEKMVEKLLSDMINPVKRSNFHHAINKLRSYSPLFPTI